MMKVPGFLLMFIFSAVISATAQPLSPSGLAALKKDEDSLKIYSREMIMDKTAAQRFNADSVFIRMLVRSLKNP